MGNKHLTQHYGDCAASGKASKPEDSCTSDQLLKRMRRYFEARTGDAAIDILGSPKTFAPDILDQNEGVIYFREIRDETPHEGRCNKLILTTVTDEGVTDLVLRFGDKASETDLQHSPVTILHGDMEVNVNYWGRDIRQAEAEIKRLIQHHDFNMKPFRKVFSLLEKAEALKL